MAILHGKIRCPLVSTVLAIEFIIVSNSWK